MSPKPIKLFYNLAPFPDKWIKLVHVNAVQLCL